MSELVLERQEDDRGLVLTAETLSPLDWLRLTSSYPDVLPVWQSLGCLECARMRHEAENRLGYSLPVVKALFHNETDHPAVGPRLPGGNGVVVGCQLRGFGNIPDELRDSPPPCQERVGGTVIVRFNDADVDGLGLFNELILEN